MFKETGLLGELSFGKATHSQLTVRKSKDAHPLYTATVTGEMPLAPDSAEEGVRRLLITVLSPSGLQLLLQK